MRPAPARLPRGAALVAALAIAAAGCGSGDDGPPPPPPAASLTKAQFLREADRICFAAESRIEAAADDLVAGPGEPAPAEVRRVALNVVVPALRAEVDAIGALPAPAGDEAEIDAILAATERGIAAIEADPAAVAEGVPPDLRRAQRLAERYGSRQCGLRG